MASKICKSLDDFVGVHKNSPAMESVRNRLQGKISAHTHENMDELIDACLFFIAEIEKALWAHEPNESLLEIYHAAFRQMEHLIALKGKDNRHKFIIVIPVADRPQHLKSCLDSLLHLCRSFAYGGFANHRYQKLAVIIADDSRDAENIIRNKEMARHYGEQGIETRYLGASEQLDLMDALSEADKSALSRILGNTGREAFYHKGPSIMRNIAYLKLNEISRDDEKILFYFIDSDQEFRVKVSAPAGDRNLYATNYFHYLDRIFSETDARILTGKVVGDPPVSPAVMAGNFLEDIICFLHRLAESGPSRPCQFHGARQQNGEEASYHDMAALFGFIPSKESYQYPCTLRGEHDNSRCFSHFSGKLNRFFYGEHPTRKTYYRHEDIIAGIRPARTIYTGNYIFKPEGLKHFIPFATLKLRMAGPVLGRLIKSEIGDRFVSANLPMLHKRTVGTTGQSEFRPGISAAISTIDLSEEFERQFYGDVMLFTIEKLSGMGYPGLTPAHELIASALESTHETMQQQYNKKRLVILEKLDILKAIVHDRKNWWNNSSEHTEAVNNFNRFMDNIAHNFGDNAYDLVNSSSNKAKRHAGIMEAITRYAEDDQAWAEMLARSGKRAQALSA